MNKRSRTDRKIDEAMTHAVARANRMLGDTEYILVEAHCPNCKSPDINLKAKLPFPQLQCWECKTIYTPNG